MRYVVTELNIRLSLKGNPHLTNKYAMEFARKLADVMSRSEIEAMYTHFNDSDKPAQKKANIAGRDISLSAAPRSIVCVDLNGKEIERLVLPY